MIDGFFWGGINIRKFCRIFLRDFWMVIAVMVITYLVLGFVDKQTYMPRYTSTAVAAVYPISSSNRFHTIESVSELSSKTEAISSMFNSALFQSGLRNQDPSLKDCTIESSSVANTDLLVMHSTSDNPEYALRGISVALDYYSQFSKDFTGASEIKIILGPEAPALVAEGSKIQNKRSLICVLSGLMMSGLLLFMYVAQKTYKTERSIRRRHKNVRFFSLPFIKSESENKQGFFLKKNSQDPIKKLALEIKQVLHKYNKNTLLVTSYADKDGGTAFLSELARELAEQSEKVLLIETESSQSNSVPGPEASDDMEKHTLLDILQQSCNVEDAMIYREELKGHCIRWSPDSLDEDISYTTDDVKHMLSDCMEYADIVLVNGSAWHPSRLAKMWHEAVDASIALCREDDADYLKVDNMLSDLQKGDTYFVGCVLLGF